jgi:hypothetical protein
MYSAYTSSEMAVVRPFCNVRVLLTSISAICHAGRTRLASRFSPRSLGFNTELHYVRSVMVQVTLEQGFLPRFFLFPLASVLHSFVTYPAFRDTPDQAACYRIIGHYKLWPSSLGWSQRRMTFISTD